MNTTAAYLNSLAQADPLAARVRMFLSRQPDAVITPTTIRKENYLDFAEGRVRVFASCLNEQGGVTDPADGKEHEYVTASLAKAGAVLLQAGRCVELKETILKAMDWACCCLGTNRVPDDHADFTTHMLIQAYELLAELADPARVEGWSGHLRNVDPERTYSQTERNFPDIRQIRNWATYAMHGEMMRYRAGLTDSTAFIDKYLPHQLPRFTAEGLYRDPNLPAAYDMAARDQLGGLLAAGYRGEGVGLLETLLRRGARTMLFTQSAGGSTSCGGRSNQLLWNELTFAHICEREAAYYRAAGDEAWAGAFKRAARWAYQSIRTWAEDPGEFRLVKNRFPSDQRVGYEFYAYHSTYSLYAAQIAVSCYLDADDSIAEAPAPCDVGEYVVHLPSFHRIYAAAGSSRGGYHLVVDTAAQMGQDATGWVRLHRENMPEELALSTGIGGLDGEIPWLFYRAKMTIPAPLLPAAIGPIWRDEHGVWHRLSNYGRRQHEVFHALDADGQPLQAEKLPWRSEVTVETPGHGSEDELQFSIVHTANPVSRGDDLDPATPGANVSEVYRRAIGDIIPRPGNGSAERIEERYRIGSGGVTAEWRLAGAAGAIITATGVTVPLLVTNGTDRSSIICEGNQVTVEYKGARYVIRPAGDAGDAELEVLPGLMPNRNGHYRLAQWTRKGTADIMMQFELVPM